MKAEPQPNYDVNRASGLTAITAVGSSDLLGVLGANATARGLTAKKTDWILKTFGGQISGFVITGINGEICIVDKSACRWMKQSEMWWLMHESNELPPSTPNKIAEPPPVSGGEAKGKLSNEN